LSHFIPGNTVSGESELDVLFNYLCGWEIVHADEFAERDSKCREWLEEEIGEDWTLKKFFDKHIELWAAQDLCFEIYDIREGEIKYVYK
jgi:hypothetical protein